MSVLSPWHCPSIERRPQRQVPRQREDSCDVDGHLLYFLSCPPTKTHADAYPKFSKEIQNHAGFPEVWLCPKMCCFFYPVISSNTQWHFLQTSGKQKIQKASSCHQVCFRIPQHVAFIDINQRIYALEKPHLAAPSYPSSAIARSREPIKAPWCSAWWFTVMGYPPGLANDIFRHIQTMIFPRRLSRSVCCETFIRVWGVRAPYT